MKTLNLTLKKQWFGMILSGEKPEEYREIKEYWARRLLIFLDPCGLEPGELDEMVCDMRNPFNRHNGPSDLLDYFGVKFRHFDAIRFVNGYGNDRPTFVIEAPGLTIKKGKEEWGAEKGKYYFAFGLGKVLDSWNIELRSERL
jgi:hypothetical protein